MVLLTTLVAIAAGLTFGLLGRRVRVPVLPKADADQADTNPDRAQGVVDTGNLALQPTSDQLPISFRIKLGEAYYNQGIVNPGAQASRYLGEHGEPMTIRFDDATRPVESMINRTANPGGYVRAVGGNARIRDWFQENFHWGETVEAEVVDSKTILLHRKAGR